MLRKSLLFCILLSVCAFVATAAAQSATLTAAQVVEKNTAAVGGLQAWRAVHTMTWTGKLDAGAGDSAARSMRVARSRVAPASSMDHGAMATPDTSNEKQVQLPFVFNMKRPNKSRLEVEFAGKKAIQVYDGTNGWKLRPYLNRNDVEPFTPDELKSESEQSQLDGPLVDSAAKGSQVEMEGIEKIEGKDAYKLKVTLKNGPARHVWVDAKSFLEVKREGTPRRMDGKMHNVYVYLRDYRSVQGVMVPHLMETTVDGYPGGHKMVLESVVINPKLDDSLFTKAQVK